MKSAKADFIMGCRQEMAKKNTQSRKGGKKRYQIEVTSITLFLWGFCALFFMAWIFVLGVFVGRGFLPGADSTLVDLKTQVAKLQEMMARNKRVEPGSQKKESIDEKLAFYEKLESKKDEAKRKEQSAPASKDGVRNGSSEGTGTETWKKENNARVEPPKPGQGEIKTAPPAGEVGYTLQLASLEEKEKAETMVKDLASRGYEAYFYEVRVKGKTYFRVRCGRFMTREEAGVYASKLLKEAKIRGFVSKVE
jgi:cell division protein FtsN